MIIGVTETLEYLRCRQRWDFGSVNRMNLENIVPKSPALPLGTALHEALKAWCRYPDDSLTQFYRIAVKQIHDDILERYKERVGVYPDASELDKVNEALLMGEAMMANYQAYWRAPLPDGFELVSPEQEIRVPIPGTEHVPDHLHVFESRETSQHCLICGVAEVDHGTLQPHYLRGRLDGIIVDTRNGLLYDMDHKSYSNRPREETIRTNMQFTMYDWMLRQLALGPVGGIAYDGMWKRAAPPRGSEVKDLFCRLRIEHTPGELQQCQDMLVALSQEMANKPPIIIHRAWDGACEWGCQFNELCRAKSRGDDWQHLRDRNYAPKAAYDEAPREIA